MPTAGFIFPSIDPVALAVGPISIKWYGLAYLTGLLLGWGYIRHLLSSPRIWAPRAVPMTLSQVDDLLLYMTVGVVFGGRFGYIFLYEPETYFADPIKMIKVWEGGMSFHGALMGCALACYLFGRNNKVSGLTATDLVTASVPMGLIFGRLANFINAELWGRSTDVAWAVTFCNDRIKAAHGGICPAGDIPRHPSQLYEAALEGVVLFLVLRLLTHRFNALNKPGLVSGAFLIGYGLARSAAEFFREPHFMAGPVTAGQLYSIPMILLGVYFIWQAQRAVAVQAKA